MFVVHDSPSRVREGLLRGLDIPYRIAVDEQLLGYRAWGLGEVGRLKSVLDVGMWLRHARRVLRERRRPRAGSRPLHLGGDFVVGPDGRVTYSHPQRRTDDRPAAQDLVRELEKAGGSRTTS